MEASSVDAFVNGFKRATVSFEAEQSALLDGPAPLPRQRQRQRRSLPPPSPPATSSLEQETAAASEGRKKRGAEAAKFYTDLLGKRPRVEQRRAAVGDVAVKKDVGVVVPRAAPASPSAACKACGGSYTGPYRVHAASLGHVLRSINAPATPATPPAAPAARPAAAAAAEEAGANAEGERDKKKLSKDEERYGRGYTMAQRMGWQAGRGLGAHEDGRTTPLATQRWDARGVGADLGDGPVPSRITHVGAASERRRQSFTEKRTDGKLAGQAAEAAEAARKKRAVQAARDELFGPMLD